MANIYTYGSASQGTSSPTTNPLIYPVARAYQGTSQACILDLTPPTFAGVSSLTLQSFGQIRVQYAAASDASAPIKYEIYIKQSDPINLFYSSNIVAITDKLQFDIFTLPNGVILNSSAPYYIGVKAVDAVGNRDNNLVNMNITTSGISGSGSSEYEVAGVFTVDSSGNFIGSLWATINDELVTSLPRLGTASYTIYDKNSALVAGMSESGITPDANGRFTITPIVSTLDLIGNFYTVKATIVVDSLPRNNYLAISGTSSDVGGSVFEARGMFSISANNQLRGSFWAVKDGDHIVSGLSTASYTIYDADGNTIGITESSMVATSGVYKITPVGAEAILDLTHYTVKITITTSEKTINSVLGIALGE